MATSEMIGQYFLKSNYDTDNAWIECSVRVFRDYNDDLFRETPLNNSFNFMGNKSSLKWKKFDDRLISKLDSNSSKFYERLLELNSQTNKL